MTRVIAWMWFEGFGLPGSPWNSTTDPEVAKAMRKLGHEVIGLVAANRADAALFAHLSSKGNKE